MEEFFGAYKNWLEVLYFNFSNEQEVPNTAFIFYMLVAFYETSTLKIWNYAIKNVTLAQKLKWSNK